MNYQITKQLLDVVSSYFDLSKIKISTENNDFKGRPYKSDFVTLIEENDVYFEVFDNEIIVAYFNNHLHFEDYTSELEEGEPDFIQRAKEFLSQLFTLPILIVEKYKGKTLVSEKYYFLMPDGKRECIVCIWHGLVKIFNPFTKKTVLKTLWHYDIKKGHFIKENNIL